MELGTNIWRARKQLQLSQEQLGAMVGVTRQTISNWELNETVPDAKQLLALSKALQVSLDALVDNESPDIQKKELLSEESCDTQQRARRIIIVLSVVIIVLVLAFISAS